MDNSPAASNFADFSFKNARWQAGTSWFPVILLFPLGLSFALLGSGKTLGDTLGFRFAGLVCIAFAIFSLRLARYGHQSLQLTNGILTWQRGGWPVKRKNSSIDLTTVTTIQGYAQTNWDAGRPIRTWNLSLFDAKGAEFRLNLTSFSIKHRRLFFETIMPLLQNPHITKQGQIREVVKAMTGYAFFNSLANQLPASCP